MNKIALEITSEGWEITVIIDGKEYKEKYVATATGAKSIEGDFESEDDILLRINYYQKIMYN